MHITPEESDKLLQYARHLGIKINKLIQYLDKSSYNGKPKPLVSNTVSESQSMDYSVDPMYPDLPQEFLAQP
jgi:hypothetical protein